MIEREGVINDVDFGKTEIVLEFLNFIHHKPRAAETDFGTKHPTS